MKLKKLAYLSILSLTTFGLAACGGDGGSSPQPPIQDETIPLPSIAIMGQPLTYQSMLTNSGGALTSIAKNSDQSIEITSISTSGSNLKFAPTTPIGDISECKKGLKLNPGDNCFITYNVTSEKEGLQSGEIKIEAEDSDGAPIVVKPIQVSSTFVSEDSNLLPKLVFLDDALVFSAGLATKVRVQNNPTGTTESIATVRAAQLNLSDCFKGKLSSSGSTLFINGIPSGSIGTFALQMVNDSSKMDDLQSCLKEEAIDNTSAIRLVSSNNKGGELGYEGAIVVNSNESLKMLITTDGLGNKDKLVMCDVDNGNGMVANCKETKVSQDNTTKSFYTTHSSKNMQMIFFGAKENGKTQVQVSRDLLDSSYNLEVPKDILSDNDIITSIAYSDFSNYIWLTTVSGSNGKLIQCQINDQGQLVANSCKKFNSSYVTDGRDTKLISMSYLHVGDTDYLYILDAGIKNPDNPSIYDLPPRINIFKVNEGIPIGTDNLPIYPPEGYAVYDPSWIEADDNYIYVRQYLEKRSTDEHGELKIKPYNMLGQYKLSNGRVVEDEKITAIAEKFDDTIHYAIFTLHPNKTMVYYDGDANVSLGAKGAIMKCPLHSLSGCSDVYSSYGSLGNPFFISLGL